ncbi:hypothetical protein K461DRAFT_250426 [Myriangium duriaei CBS 260.36]|uniref:Amino acid permease/ SLC12A domain-containing protein n=1 Tax=Myriangium duriaei CBS 260.36 TaxID=1168546 RepID=A0A9P4J9H1_9PEZI|nr:hypothetical protein K461DRAFT_250426 [Myriangium duriaei CBS 260.36]
MGVQNTDKIMVLHNSVCSAGGGANNVAFDIFDIDLSEPPLTWGDRWQDFKDSFKRHSLSIHQRDNARAHGGKSRDPERGNSRFVISPLTRSLRGRHLQMIALGGSIGTGLFVGSGHSLAMGGPGSLVIAYALVGTLMYCTMQALGELSVTFPIAGSFSSYSTRFIDPAWGFAMGWNYALQWLTIFPLELVSASLVLTYWGVEDIKPFAAIFLFLITIINFFGVRGYGEAEFLLSAIKGFAIVGFITLGAIINIGGGPYTSGAYSGYIGARFWKERPFKNGFKGVGPAIIFAALAFAGTELVGLAAAETKYPRRSIPTAIKQVFWKIVLFYLVSLTVVGFCVSADDPSLLTENNAVDAHASPFVIAIVNSGIQILPSAMNAVILVSVLSVANSSIFGSTRTLAALSDQGQAPKILGYIDRKGRPLVANVIALLFGLVGFSGNSKSSVKAFEWLAAISTLSSVLTWASICFAHIRFRKAWRANGRSLSELPYVSQCGETGSWIGIVLAAAVVVIQMWLGIWPIGYEKLSTLQQVENFFSSGSLTLIVVIVFYFGYRLVRRTTFHTPLTMDIVTGRSKISAETLIEEEHARQHNWPRWRLIYKMFC